MEKIKKFIPLIIGIILIGTGIFTYFRTGELVKKCTEKATAMVVNIREEIDPSADTDGVRYLYYPIIEYQAGDKTINKELGSSSTTPEYSINSKVEILYNPNNAEEFIVSGENQDIVWMILGGVGVVFLVVGVVVAKR